MKSRLPLLAATLCLALSAQAQTVVYENLTGSPLAGYSELNANNPIFGDALNLSQGGHLANVGLTLFNSSSGGNTGSILTGTMTLNIYNNSVPYAGGSLSASDPLIASVNLTWDFTGSGGLAPGFFSVGTFDLTSLNITVPQNIFVTQQFSLTSGTSTRNGVVLFPDPTIGSSPANVYISSSATPEGLYTFSGNPNQFGYHIDIQLVPEPASVALCGLGVAGLLIFRRRK
jgi:PEP-CTERM motif